MDSSAPSTTATGSAGYRRVSFFSRNRLGAKFGAIFEEIPPSRLCFWFGPLIYAASLGMVAAMLPLATCTLIVSRCDGLSFRLEELDPALAYGGAAALHAILFAPILVGVLRLGRPGLSGGYALLVADL